MDGLVSTFRDTFSESSKLDAGRLFGQSVLLSLFVLVMGIVTALDPKTAGGRSGSYAFAGLGAVVLLSMPFAYASPRAALRVLAIQGTAILLLVALTGVMSVEHLLLRRGESFRFLPGLITWTSAHGGNQLSLALPDEAAARVVRKSALAVGLLLDAVVTALCLRALLAS
jgi:hypothetical protein